MWLLNVGDLLPHCVLFPQRLKQSRMGSHLTRCFLFSKRWKNPRLFSHLKDSTWKRKKIAHEKPCWCLIILSVSLFAMLVNICSTLVLSFSKDKLTFCIPYCPHAVNRKLQSRKRSSKGHIFLFRIGTQVNSSSQYPNQEFFNHHWFIYFIKNKLFNFN